MELDTVNVNNKSTAEDRLHGQQGFTLMETAVSLLVMMVVGLGAASLFVFALGTNTRARDRELSMAVAQQQMERLRNTRFKNLNTTLTATGGANKTVTSAGRSYSVVTTIADTVVGDSTQKTITIQVRPMGGVNNAGLTEIQRIFGGVTLITQRSTSALGTN
jgi:Tfp pilus assembly protein PilV